MRFLKAPMRFLKVSMCFLKAPMRFLKAPVCYLQATFFFAGGPCEQLMVVCIANSRRIPPHHPCTSQGRYDVCRFRR